MRGVPQGAVLSPILFNFVFIHLAWQLDTVQHTRFLIYADDVTVWSTHKNVQMQYTALQKALEVIQAFAAKVGLTVSAEKTKYMTVANKAGRKKLAVHLPSIRIGAHQLAEATELRILGLRIHQAGTATAWLKAVRQTAANTIRLIRRIAPKAGGARTEVARRLACAVLQPRLVYEAQFQRLTVSQHAKLEAINREAMRAISGLPRITPIPVLQEQAQLNTIDELINQRRAVRLSKYAYLQNGHALYDHFNPGNLALPESQDELPPWGYTIITSNKTSHLQRRRTKEGKAQLSPLPNHPGPDDQCLLYTDASCTGTHGVTAWTSPTHPSIEGSIPYASATCTPILLELQAIHDALLCAAASNEDLNTINLRTDSTQVIHYLKQVAQTPIICQRIHQLHSKMPSKVVVSWVPGHASIAGNERADFLSHNCPAPSSPAQLPSDPWATRMAVRVLSYLRVRFSSPSILPGWRRLYYEGSDWAWLLLLPARVDGKGTTEDM